MYFFNAFYKMKASFFQSSIKKLYYTKTRIHNVSDLRYTLAWNLTHSIVQVLVASFGI